MRFRIKWFCIVLYLCMYCKRRKRDISMLARTDLAGKTIRNSLSHLYIYLSRCDTHVGFYIGCHALLIICEFWVCFVRGFIVSALWLFFSSRPARMKWFESDFEWLFEAVSLRVDWFICALFTTYLYSIWKNIWIDAHSWAKSQFAYYGRHRHPHKVSLIKYCNLIPDRRHVCVSSRRSRHLPFT